MPITYVTKDITTVTAGIIAHGCNAQGVMGSGVAFFLRQKWPQIFSEYLKLCTTALKENKDILGRVDYVNVEPGTLVVANCITQHLYGYDGHKYAYPEAIRTSLQHVMYTAQMYSCPVYIPKIGAGRGGLDWATEVEPIIKDLADKFPDTPIYVCSWAE